jgi:hypothetical protein
MYRKIHSIILLYLSLQSYSPSSLNISKFKYSFAATQKSSVLVSLDQTPNGVRPRLLTEPSNVQCKQQI